MYGSNFTEGEVENTLPPVLHREEKAQGLIEKHQKSVPVFIQHQYTFPYFENKIQFSVP